MAKKINNLDTLDQEIVRLQAKAKTLENELDHSLDYLHDNYSSMIMNSVLTRAAGGIKNGVIGTILSIVINNEKLMAALTKITGRLADKATEGLERLAGKFMKKNSD